jgi:hypothetical protein
MKKQTDNAVPPVPLSRLVSRYLEVSRGCRESALESMISALWKNYPEWPSTFGPCSEKCGGSGRGSGPCASCVELAIGILVGDPLAASGLRRHIVDARFEARKLRDLISSANVKSVARRRLSVQSEANEGRYPPLPPLSSMRRQSKEN